MEQVIDRISEIQRIIEREVEWPLTDHVDRAEVLPWLRQVNAGLLRLQIIADEIEMQAEE